MSGQCKCGAKLSDKRKTRCRKCWLKRGPDVPPEERQPRLGKCGHPVSRLNTEVCRRCYENGAATRATAILTVQPQGEREQAVLEALKALGGVTIEALAARISTTQGQALDALIAMRDRGLNLHQLGDRWSLEKNVPISERTFEYTSRPDNTYHFGISSDQHLCSKYAREDVLHDLYDSFDVAGVDRVFNAGNWIDGEDEKNRFDLLVHGLEPQVKYLAEKYPKRDGIMTYAIWGEDHEGWYSRREAIDVGRFAEGQMRTAGREDWVDLGFVEAKVDLVNANTGVRATLVVMHPGGGSSYAYSYRPQKIVESMSGGEKPNVLIIGHYHKLSCNIIRNVWSIQAGCAQDQTVFMRKKGLEAHVGGLIVTLQQDPETGAIFGCRPDQRIYYDTRYYNDRFSKTTAVVQAERRLGGTVPLK